MAYICPARWNLPAGLFLLCVLRCFLKSWANYKSAQPVTVVYNDKGEVYDLQKDTNFEVAKISYVGTTKVTIGNDSLEIEDIELYDGFAKDDWTVKSHNDYTDKDAYAKADVVTGEVEVSMATISPSTALFTRRLLMLSASPALIWATRLRLLLLTAIFTTLRR